MKQVRDVEALRAAIQARDLTQREVARLAECSKGMVCWILDGKPVSDLLAVRLARSLRRPVGELFASIDASREQSKTKQRAGV